MQKVYSRINWENEPSKNTAVNEDNLNRMDYAINVIDGRVVSLYGYQDRVSQSEANSKTYASNAKTSEINAEESAVKAKESEELAKQYRNEAFSTTPDGYDEVVEKVDLMDIQTSDSNTLYNTKQGGLRLIGMKGNTEQETLTGTNLFGGLAFANALVESGVQATIDTTSKTVALVAGNSTSLFEYVGDFRENTQYTIFFKGINSNSEYLSNTNLQIRYSDGTTDALRFNTTGAKTLKYTASGKTLSSIEGVWETSIATFYYEDFGIFEGVLTLDDFEPYCGNQPAPNPEYPTAIENTFDCVEIMQGYYQYSTGNYYTGANYICNKRSIPCKGGDIVKLSAKNASILSMIYFTDDIYHSYKTSSGANEFEFTVPSGATNFKFNINKSGGLNPSTVGKITLTVNGKYVGQIVERGKNCINMDKCINGFVTSDLTFSDSTAYWITNYFIPFDKYTLSWEFLASSNEYMYVIWYDENLSPIRRSLYKGIDSAKITIGDTQHGPWIKICWLKSAFANVQLEKGTTATTYEPYTEHVATFYTDEPIRKGDVLFKDDDSRLWTVERNAEERNVADYYITKLADSYQTDNTNIFTANISKKTIGTEVLCTHFSEADVFKVNNDTIGVEANSANKQIYIRIGQQMTTDEFKTWCNENDVKIQYELATPTYEILDTASQLALNSLKTFKDATHIEVDSKIQPEGCEWEFGTSDVSARCIRNELRHDTQDIKIAELTTALLALGSEV